MALKEQSLSLFEKQLGLDNHWKRIRCHGNYHLKNIFFKNDQVIIDSFSQNPFQTLQERRRKRSALKDIACLFYSFHSTAWENINDQQSKNEYVSCWTKSVYSTFMDAYLKEVGNADFLPEQDCFIFMLKAYLVERAWQSLADKLSVDQKLTEFDLTLFLSFYANHANN